jgi:hypothetical protein
MSDNSERFDWSVEVCDAAVDVAMQRGGDSTLRVVGLCLTSSRAMDRLLEALTNAGLTRAGCAHHHATCDACGEGLTGLPETRRPAP